LTDEGSKEEITTKSTKSTKEEKVIADLRLQIAYIKKKRCI